MSDINKRNYLIQLYEVYKSLLTDKKQNIFENYYYEDLSINEIAENLEITKNAVYNSLQKTEKELIDYEKNLLIIYRYNTNIEVLKQNKVSDYIINKIK